jgi:hypothetical protein
MSHPNVLSCAILVSKLGEQSAEIDVRLAASEAETMQLVASSRDAVERSRNLLNKLNSR